MSRHRTIFCASRQFVHKRCLLRGWGREVFARKLAGVISEVANKSLFSTLEGRIKFIYNSIQLNKVVGRELNENPFEAMEMRLKNCGGLCRHNFRFKRLIGMVSRGDEQAILCQRPPTTQIIYHIYNMKLKRRHKCSIF